MELETLREENSGNLKQIGELEGVVAELQPKAE